MHSLASDQGGERHGVAVASSGRGRSRRLRVTTRDSQDDLSLLRSWPAGIPPAPRRRLRESPASAVGAVLELIGAVIAGVVKLATYLICRLTGPQNPSPERRSLMRRSLMRRRPELPWSGTARREYRGRWGG